MSLKVKNCLSTIQGQGDKTKAGLFAHDLRRVEAGKIRCGKAHFNAPQVREAPAASVGARNFDDLKVRVNS
jgi:hypothetical protein